MSEGKENGRVIGSASRTESMQPEAQDRRTEGESHQQLTSTSTKRKRSSRLSDGDERDGKDRDVAEEEAEHDITEASIEPLLKMPSASTLRDRRANASPEKLKRGKFESLAIQAIGSRPPKKPRLEANIDIIYDSTGTPQLSAFPSRTIAGDGCPYRSPLDSQRKISAGSNTSDTTTITELLHTPAQSSSGTPKKRTFSLLHSICRDNAILLHFVSFLTLPSLISLYSISRPFHYLFNRHQTSFVLSSMRTWAPNADRIYPWRCYQSLCVKDPTKLQKRRLKDKETEVNKKWTDLRDVPSLRWLQMVVWREGVCRDMMVQLATQGLRTPYATLESVKKMWFIMDLPLNTHRIALIHNTDYITNDVLLGMTFFLMKVDMMFTDPMAPCYPLNHPNQYLHPNKYGGGLQTGIPLRKLLLAERHLSSLWRVMRGWSWDGGFGKGSNHHMTRLDLLRLWIRHKYNLPANADEDTKQMSIMGIPWHEIGTAGLERTGVAFHDLTDPTTNKVIRTIPIVNPSIAGAGLTDHQADQILYPHRKRIILPKEKPREMLLRPDELLIREGVRRQLQMHKQWWKIMFYGFCDDLGRAIKVPKEDEVLERLRERPYWRPKKRAIAKE